MRVHIATVVILGACGGGGGGNPDAANPDTRAIDAAPDAPSFCPTPLVVNPASAHEITIANDSPALGIFDPSTIYPSGASGGVMAYSAVPDQLTIRTHLAVSSDHGATWTGVAELNTPEATSITSGECTGGTCTGNLISEVTSLIYDADDPDANARWKLFAHRYLVSPGTMGPVLHYALGTIVLQTAPAPQGPWTAPKKLIGWNHPLSTYPSTGIVANVSTLPGTAQDCKALTEPGAIWLPGVIDVAVGCVYGADNAIRIELLRSPDHGASWVSIGTMLRPADVAPCFGATAQINGPDLFATGGHEFLSVTPADALGYHGCLVLPIDDPVAGHVQRDAMDRAIVSKHITASQFDGACTYSDDGGGYALDIGFLQAARPFRMFSAP